MTPYNLCGEHLKKKKEKDEEKKNPKNLLLYRPRLRRSLDLHSPRIWGPSMSTSPILQVLGLIFYGLGSSL